MLSGEMIARYYTAIMVGEEKVDSGRYWIDDKLTVNSTKKMKS